MSNLYCKECDALTTPARPGEPFHPCSGFTDDGEPIYACESYLSEHLPVLSDEAPTAELNEAKAKIAELEKWLQQIARTNCTCDWWTNAADPAEHDLYCMFRVMTGYQEQPQ